MDSGKKALENTTLDMLKIKRSLAAQLTIAGITLALALLFPLLARNHLTPAQQISLGIFIMAAILWITELIPPFATALAIIILQIVFLGRPGGPLGFKESGVESYQVFLNPIASPVIILFFGGLILAAAATKTGADRFLASRLLAAFTCSHSRLLIGVMVVTALFSMVMSNVAACVMMFAMVSPILASDNEAFRKQLALGIPIAANLGGLGTIIGTAPNVIAVTMLAAQGVFVSFLSWLLIGVPFVFLMLFVSAKVLISFIPQPEIDEAIVLEQPKQPNSIALFVLLTAGITFLLWILEPLHKLPAPIVALLPILLFTITGVLTAKDLRQLDWDVLLLVAGGLSLGVALQASGLLSKFQEFIYPFAQVPAVSFFAFIAAALVLSNFMSNTSAASIIIPLTASGMLIDRSMGTFAVTFAVSLAMSLPVSTPTNAVAFARGSLSTTDFLKIGTAISLIGVIIAIGYFFVLKRSGIFSLLVR